jgi:alpha-beta hydrolase superfamily lysophospholipase
MGMKSIKNKESNIKSGKQPTKTDSLPISDGLVMYLHGAGDSGERYVRVDFNDYSTYKDFYMIMDRTKLREVAEFILKYLENK